MDKPPGKRFSIILKIRLKNSMIVFKNPDGADASSLVQTDTTDVEQNQIRVRFIGSEDYMGKTLKVSYSSVTGIVSNVDIQISGA